MFLNSQDPRRFLEKWVYQYLKYPEKALMEGTQGRVMVDFIIEKDGKVTGVRVAKGVSPELDAEAVKVVSASPKWKPGRVAGEKVRASPWPRNGSRTLSLRGLARDARKTSSISI